MYNRNHMNKFFLHTSWFAGVALIVLLGATCSQPSSAPLSQPTPEAGAPTTETPANPTNEGNAGNNSQTGATLDLSNKGLTKLPSYVLDRTELTGLDISNNKLTGALPGEIRFLKNLKTLDMSYNQMTGLPAEVGQLSELTELNLSYNQFTGLPYELGNLKKLKILNLTGNAYAQQDLDKILEGIPNVTVIK